jgi:hypothetical protein
MFIKQAAATQEVCENLSFIKQHAVEICQSCNGPDIQYAQLAHAVITNGLLECICYCPRGASSWMWQKTQYLHAYKQHFVDENIPSKIGVWLIHGILFFFKEKLDPPKKKSLSYRRLSP